jgi:hypothetical protein
VTEVTKPLRTRPARFADCQSDVARKPRRVAAKLSTGARRTRAAMERGPGRHLKISKLVGRRRLWNPTLRIPEATLRLLQWPAFRYRDRGPRSLEAGIVWSHRDYPNGALSYGRLVRRDSSHVQNLAPHSRPNRCRSRRKGDLRRSRHSRTNDRCAGIGNMLRGERKGVAADLNKSVGEHTVGEHKNVS